MKKIIMMCCFFCVNSCSSYYTANSDKAYLKSNNGLALVVPKPLTDGNISHFYDLPSRILPAEVNIMPPT